MGKLIDLEGEKFGELTVLCRSDKHPGGHGRTAYWKCRCSCGNEVYVDSYSLRHSKHPSCGCYSAKKTSERCLSISPGERFGRLTVVRRSTPIGVKPVKWLCRCDCGNETSVPTYSLKSGVTKSCGCIHREQLAARNTTHGETDSRLNKVWRGMKARCNDKGATGYRNYGGAGVSVCEEWQRFEAFRDWAMENGYDPNAPRGKCTLDRIDPFGNYEPSNCRWVDFSVQSRNKRNSKKNH